MQATTAFCLAICLFSCAIIGCGETQTLHYAMDPDAFPGGPASQDPADEINSLLITLNERLGRDGRAQPVGDRQFDVQVYGTPTPSEMGSIKLKIQTVGRLNFRILADAEGGGDVELVDRAQLLSTTEKQALVDGMPVAEWIPYSQDDFDAENLRDFRVVRRLADGSDELLVLQDAVNLSGEYLTNAAQVVDQQRKPAIELVFNGSGVSKLRKLATGARVADTNEGPRVVSFIVDDQILGIAPIPQPLVDRLRFSGVGMTPDRISALLAIMKSGALPCRLRAVDDRLTN